MISRYRRRWYGYAAMVAPFGAVMAFLITIAVFVVMGSAPLFALIPLGLALAPATGVWWAVMITPSILEVYGDGHVLLLAKRRRIELDVREIYRIERVFRASFGKQCFVRWGATGTTFLYTAGIPRFKWFVVDLTSLNSSIDTVKVPGAKSNTR